MFCTYNVSHQALCWILRKKSIPWASQVALVVKNLPANAEDSKDVGLIPVLGRSPAEGNGNPFQYSCLENPMDRRAWRVTALGVAKSWTQLSTHTYTLLLRWSTPVLSNRNTL